MISYVARFAIVLCFGSSLDTWMCWVWSLCWIWRLLSRLLQGSLHMTEPGALKASLHWNMMHRSRSRQVRCLAIPEGVFPGAVIGKGGIHFKNITAQTGAKLVVPPESGVVEIRGGDAATAEALLRDHLQYLAEAASKIVSKLLKAVVVLSKELSGSARFQRLTSQDELLAGMRTRGALFQLSAVATREAHSTLDALAQAFTRATALEPGNVFVEASQGSVEQADLAGRLVEAAESEPAYDQMRLRFNMGKQLFFTGHNMRKPLDGLGVVSLQELKDMQERAHVNSYFSNVVRPAKATALRLHVIGDIGLAMKEHKSVATLHLLGRPRGPFAARKVAVGFFIRPRSQLAVRKVKSGSDRLAFLAFAHDDGHQDFRFKLVAQRSMEEAGDELSRAARELAERCSLQNGVLKLDPRDASAFDIDTVRFKEKDVYEGPMQLPAPPGRPLPSGHTGSCTVRLTVTRVRDPPGGVRGLSSHWEVAGTCPQLTVLQAKLLQAAATGSGLDLQERDDRVAEVRRYVDALEGFCTQLRTYL